MTTPSSRDGRSDPDLEPALERSLVAARERERERAPAADLDAMLAVVEQEIEQARGRRTFWLRSRPTWLRRVIASGAAALVVILGGAQSLRGDLGEHPAYMALAVSALAVLLGLSVHQALRPLHRPPLARWKRGGIVTLTLAATFVIAALSPHEGGEASPALVSPCLFYGLLIGVPVYLVLRILDRSRATTTASLLAACAAGLAGNLALQLHCANGDPGHLMASHFTVALLFVAGLGAAHWLVRSRPA